MNMKMLSIFPLLLITSFVFALKTDVSSYWDNLNQKADIRKDSSYQKMKSCKKAFMNTSSGKIYTAHHKIFKTCADLDSCKWTRLNTIPATQNICQLNNQELINTLQRAKQGIPLHYEEYKQSLKAYAYDLYRAIILYEIFEDYTMYKKPWNKERAIEYANRTRIEKYSTLLNKPHLEKVEDHPEYIKEDIERAITDVLNLIEEYDKIHNDNNTIQINI